MLFSHQQAYSTYSRGRYMQLAVRHLVGAVCTCFSQTQKLSYGKSARFSNGKSKAPLFIVLNT